MQTQAEGESSQQFAERVQAMIAKRAGLKAVPWDGYLKYYNLAAKVCTTSARSERLALQGVRSRSAQLRFRWGRVCEKQNLDA